MHKLNVRQPYFSMITSRIKMIELRLNDEKRQKIKIGDKIEFSCAENIEDKLFTEVVALYKAEDFKKLYEIIDIKKAGLSGTPEEVMSTMEEFYSKEKQKKYGVVGIEVKRI